MLCLTHRIQDTSRWVYVYVYVWADSIYSLLFDEFPIVASNHVWKKGMFIPLDLTIARHPASIRSTSGSSASRSPLWPMPFSTASSTTPTQSPTKETPCENDSRFDSSRAEE